MKQLKLDISFMGIFVEECTETLNLELMVEIPISEILGDSQIEAALLMAEVEKKSVRCYTSPNVKAEEDDFGVIYLIQD